MADTPTYTPASTTQITRALWPVLVRLLDVMVARKLVSNRDMVALLGQAAADLDGEGNTGDRREAANLIRSSLITRFQKK